MDPAANLVGPGCADYADAVPDGAGSIEGMSQDPVAVAASNNPMLTTLVAAVSGQLNPDVNLVDTLNGERVHRLRAGRRRVREDRPGDDRVAEDRLRDADRRSSRTTWCPARSSRTTSSARTPRCRARDLEVTGSGDELMVNDAMVICGGVQTAQRDRLPHRHGADAPELSDRHASPAGTRLPAGEVGWRSRASSSVGRASDF